MRNMLRRGIEFYAEQDSYGSKDLAKLRAEYARRSRQHCWLLLCDGQGLFYQTKWR